MTATEGACGGKASAGTCGGGIALALSCHGKGGVDDELAREERRKVGDELAVKEREKEVGAGKGRGSLVTARCGSGGGRTWRRPRCTRGRGCLEGAPVVRNRARGLGDRDGGGDLGRTWGRRWRWHVPEG